jgi:protoporphyrinogen oxidase
VRSLGGEILTGFEAVRFQVEGNRLVSLTARNSSTGEMLNLEGEHFFSTMPVQELIRGLSCPVPASVREIAEGLMYRDFITVGLLLSKLKLRERMRPQEFVKDDWIYVQEPDVMAGRLQIFNNWSPYMVAHPDTVWVGVEYFCNETDAFWKKTDEELMRFCVAEMAKIGILDEADVQDGVVLRMPKTYPAYFGTYDRFGEVRRFLDGIENLYLLGRNGMHKYNNQDHSMLTAMVTVDNIIEGRKDKDNLWSINTDESYHEAKSECGNPRPANS